MNRSAYYLLLGAALIFSSAAFSEDVDGADSLRAHVDLGQVVESGAVAPVGNITSAGQPDEAALKVFADSGYVAVIDLRGPGENRGLDEASAVVDLNMQYIAFPVVGHDAISYENAQELDNVLSEIDGPVLLHCGSGNRVGALLALRASLDGADDEQALEYGRSAGLTGLEPVVKERLSER
jgi:uncharacterized protein (TIGR01244 family)